ncbi:eukaryotic translation initiation factor 5B-like protein [Tanacetum coccineum]
MATSPANVQEGEAGGITQQISATYIPAHNIRERTKELKADAKLNVPGLLVIDTPGHEAFKNLRSRGFGLCDIAILVVDIMHGFEPQTIESLHLLRMRNTEFIVALNKVDRLYSWKTCRNAPIGKALKLQNKDVQLEFHHRVTQIITQFKEQGLNTELYNKNKDMGETYSSVPTSAISSVWQEFPSQVSDFQIISILCRHSGEGIPEMLLLLVQWAEKTMVEKLTYINDIQCTVLEVKVVEGLGTTIDVVLVNGVLHEGDEIVVCGFQGPIHTTIRSLLTPHPMKELRVKGAYIHHKEIKAAQGIIVTAQLLIELNIHMVSLKQNLEHAVAGTALYVVGPSDDLDDIKESVMADMRNVMNRIDKSGEGVYVQASTLGSLEALLEFLKTPTVNIPVSSIGIGPVHKKDVMKAAAMLDKKKEFATILAFDVKVTPEAREIADGLDIKIFTADIIYHLFDQFNAYIENFKEEKKKEAAEDAVFPCVLQIMPHCVFNKKDPIILDVNVLEGILKIGTPICIPQKDFVNIGRISSIEKNKQQFDSTRKGEQVAIKLTGSNREEKQKMFGWHFEMEDELVSHISRESINILKTNYRDELSNEDWKLNADPRKVRAVEVQKGDDRVTLWRVPDIAFMPLVIPCRWGYVVLLRGQGVSAPNEGRAGKQGDERGCYGELKRLRRKSNKQSDALTAIRLRTDHPFLASGYPESATPSVAPTLLKKDSESFVDFSATSEGLQIPCILSNTLSAPVDTVVVTTTSTKAKLAAGVNPDLAGPSQLEESEGSDDSLLVLDTLDPSEAKRWYVPRWNITNDSLLDDGSFPVVLVGSEHDKYVLVSEVEKEAETGEVVRLLTKFPPPHLFEEVKSACMWRRCSSQVALNDAQLACTEAETKITTLSSKRDRLASEVSSLLAGFKDFKERIEVQQEEQAQELYNRVAELEAHVMDVSGRLEGEFYPTYLTLLAGKRWLLSHGIQLALFKCLKSLEYQGILGHALGRAIDFGMQEGLEVGHEHRVARRSLSAVDAYNPEVASANYVNAVRALEDAYFPLVNLLKSKKDAGMDEVLVCFLLDRPLAKLSEVASLQPCIEQLSIPIHHAGDKMPGGETSLSFALMNVHARAEGAKKHVAALRQLMMEIVSAPLSS